MKIGFNAKERSQQDWTDLFAMADPKLKIKSIVKPAGSHNSIIEVEFGA